MIVLPPPCGSHAHMQCVGVLGVVVVLALRLWVNFTLPFGLSR